MPEEERGRGRRLGLEPQREARVRVALAERDALEALRARAVPQDGLRLFGGREDRAAVRKARRAEEAHVLWRVELGDHPAVGVDLRGAGLGREEDVPVLEERRALGVRVRGRGLLVARDAPVGIQLEEPARGAVEDEEAVLARRREVRRLAEPGQAAHAPPRRVEEADFALWRALARDRDRERALRERGRREGARKERRGGARPHAAVSGGGAVQ